MAIKTDRIVAQLVRESEIQYYGRLSTIVGTIQLHDLGQGPYFSMTGTIGPKANPGTCGCIHDELVQAWPDLAKYVKWHLTSVRGPMHYIANAKYWAGWSGYCDGKDSSPPNFEHLKKTIVWGVLEGETDDVLRAFLNPNPDIEAKGVFAALAQPLVDMLTARHAALMEAFYTDMLELFAGQIVRGSACGETLPSIELMAQDAKAAEEKRFLDSRTKSQ